MSVCNQFGFYGKCLQKNVCGAVLISITETDLWDVCRESLIAGTDMIP